MSAKVKKISIELVGVASDKNNTKVRFTCDVNELKSIHGLCYAVVKQVYSQFRNKYRNNVPTFVKSNMDWTFIVSENGKAKINSGDYMTEIGYSSLRLTPSVKKAKELDAKEWKEYMHTTAAFLENVIKANNEFAKNVRYAMQMKERVE